MPQKWPKLANFSQNGGVIDVKTFMGAYMGAFMQEPLLWARAAFWAAAP